MLEWKTRILTLMFSVGFVWEWLDSLRSNWNW
jgi:hypothetical protein